jgi:hypothetical protein
MKAAGKKGSAMKNAREAMLHTGRELVLPEQEGTVAFIRRFRITRPTVLTFAYYEDVPILTAWSGRGVLSFISRRAAIRAFLKHCPKGLSLATADEEDDIPSEKKSKKAKGDKK